MSPAPGSFRPSAKPSRRRWVIAAPLAVAAALGLGAAGAARVPLQKASGAAGAGLKIEVVQPRAPSISPGPRMEVGELVDGYRHVAHRPTDTGDLLGEIYADAWLEPLPPMPPPPRWRDEEPPEPRLVAELRPTAPQPAAVEVVASNPYGFDRPAPDYAADRRARRDRIERIEMERMARRERLDRREMEHMARRERFEHREIGRMARREQPAPWRRVGDYPRPARLDAETAFY